MTGRPANLSNLLHGIYQQEEHKLSDWIHYLEQLGALAGAFVLALPTAIERERSTRLMGLRTFPLVAMATCAFVLIGRGFFPHSASEAMARIVQGIVTGIGFIGGGAILKFKDRLVGTATAASVWLTGAIGVAVGLGEYGIAIALSAANFAILRYLGKLDDSDNGGADDLDDAKRSD
jgi:putative Mg2+ transporter-C (MgtC) family protein